MSEDRTTSVADFIREAIERSAKTQTEISAEAGFPRSSVLSMIKQGQTKMPLARIPQMARALDVDPLAFFRLAMSEYMPELLQICDQMYRPEAPGEVERELLAQLRQRAGGRPLKLTPKVRQAMARFLAELD